VKTVGHTKTCRDNVSGVTANFGHHSSRTDIVTFTAYGAIPRSIIRRVVTQRERPVTWSGPGDNGAYSACVGLMLR